MLYSGLVLIWVLEINFEFTLLCTVENVSWCQYKSSKLAIPSLLSKNFKGSLQNDSNAEKARYLAKIIEP